MDIAEVVSDLRVGFCLLTAGDYQYAAYYDKERCMTVASRKISSKKWIYQILPTSVAWDSHNYITMAVDSDGHLHVAGNMHAVKLIYFRSEKPWDITTLKRFVMTGKQEDSVTYPKFLNDPNGQLVFNYRDGGSGRGVHIYNKYDILTMTYHHCDYGSGQLVVDEKSMKPLDKKIEVVRGLPKKLDHLESDFKGMEIRHVNDIGDSGDGSMRYLLQWESLGAKRDQKPALPFPEPSKLRLYKLTMK